MKRRNVHQCLTCQPLCLLSDKTCSRACVCCVCHHVVCAASVSVHGVLLVIINSLSYVAAVMLLMCATLDVCHGHTFVHLIGTGAILCVFLGDFLFIQRNNFVSRCSVAACRLHSSLHFNLSLGNAHMHIP